MKNGKFQKAIITNKVHEVGSIFSKRCSIISSAVKFGNRK